MGSAPTPTARGTPGGLKMLDGYQSLVTFANATTIKLYEKSVTPPGMDGGEPVDTTTMHNTTYETRAPRNLVTLTEMTFVAAYDPDAYDEILAILNAQTTITVTFSDGSTLAFYGFLQKFEPASMERGGQPEATVTIIPTNTDPSDWSEQSPALADVSGTP